ncbi:MAG TPA: hypothetical protein VFM53_06950 [Anaeromyxobacteraceae bacterium]|nr:hypothetical protein [Anaeromyxobacteraceae bacterium]
MSVRTMMAVTGILAAVAAPAGRTLACGRGPMAAVPMAGPMVGMAVPAVGLTVAALPVGSVAVVVNGAGFFRAGPTWYQPFQAPTGMMYRVVPAPGGM